MGIMSNTVSICHFRVQGELTGEGLLSDLFDRAPGLLAKQGFNSINETADELSLGWVETEDPKSTTFNDCWRDRYLMFSLRRDQRKVPPALLKEHLEKAEAQFLADNLGYTRVPKLKKEELKEQVRLKLLAKSLPAPSVYDVVWDTEKNVVTFTTLSPKTVELFQDHFKKTFEGLRLTALHPYERAMSVLGDQDRRLLAQANKASGDSYLELIQENQWIGRDFLSWLLYQTLNGDSEYRVNQGGPEANGAQFIGYVNDKVVLVGEGEGGTQMVTVNGPQERFREVKSAMLDRKQISEATIHLETPDGSWCLTLKGGLFHFASFACPAVKLEKDNTTDERTEREAVFFERMALLEKGLQLFDSLFCTFLQVRLGSGWYGVEGEIVEWLEAA